MALSQEQLKQLAQAYYATVPASSIPQSAKDTGQVAGIPSLQEKAQAHYATVPASQIPQSAKDTGQVVGIPAQNVVAQEVKTPALPTSLQEKAQAYYATIPASQIPEEAKRTGQVAGIPSQWDNKSWWAGKTEEEKSEAYYATVPASERPAYTDTRFNIPELEALVQQERAARGTIDNITAEMWEKSGGSEQKYQKLLDASSEFNNAEVALQNSIAELRSWGWMETSEEFAKNNPNAVIQVAGGWYRPIVNQTSPLWDEYNGDLGAVSAALVPLILTIDKQIAAVPQRTSDMQPVVSWLRGEHDRLQLEMNAISDKYPRFEGSAALWSPEDYSTYMQLQGQDVAVSEHMIPAYDWLTFTAEAAKDKQKDIYKLTGQFAGAGQSQVTEETATVALPEGYEHFMALQELKPYIEFKAKWIRSGDKVTLTGETVVDVAGALEGGVKPETLVNYGYDSASINKMARQISAVGELRDKNLIGSDNTLNPAAAAAAGISFATLMAAGYGYSKKDNPNGIKRADYNALLETAGAGAGGGLGIVGPVGGEGAGEEVVIKASGVVVAGESSDAGFEAAENYASLVSSEVYIPTIPEYRVMHPEMTSGALLDSYEAKYGDVEAGYVMGTWKYENMPTNPDYRVVGAKVEKKPTGVQEIPLTIFAGSLISPPQATIKTDVYPIPAISYDTYVAQFIQGLKDAGLQPQGNKQAVEAWETEMGNIAGNQYLQTYGSKEATVSALTGVGVRAGFPALKATMPEYTVGDVKWWEWGLTGLNVATAGELGTGVRFISYPLEKILGGVGWLAGETPGVRTILPRIASEFGFGASATEGEIINAASKVQTLENQILQAQNALTGLKPGTTAYTNALRQLGSLEAGYEVAAGNLEAFITGARLTPEMMSPALRQALGVAEYQGVGAVEIPVISPEYYSRGIQANRIVSSMEPAEGTIWTEGRLNPYVGNKAVIESVASGERSLGLLDDFYTKADLVSVEKAGLATKTVNVATRVGGVAEEIVVYNPKLVSDVELGNAIEAISGSFQRGSGLLEVQRNIALGRALGYTDSDIATYLREVATNWEARGFSKAPFTMEDIGNYSAEWYEAVGGKALGSRLIPGGQWVDVGLGEIRYVKPVLGGDTSVPSGPVLETVYPGTQGYIRTPEGLVWQPGRRAGEIMEQYVFPTEALEGGLGQYPIAKYLPPELFPRSGVTAGAIRGGYFVPPEQWGGIGGFASPSGWKEISAPSWSPFKYVEPRVLTKPLPITGGGVVASPRVSVATAEEPALWYETTPEGLVIPRWFPKPMGATVAYPAEAVPPEIPSVVPATVPTVLTGLEALAPSPALNLFNIPQFDTSTLLGVAPAVALETAPALIQTPILAPILTPILTTTPMPYYPVEVLPVEKVPPPLPLPLPSLGGLPGLGGGGSGYAGLQSPFEGVSRTIPRLVVYMPSPKLKTPTIEKHGTHSTYVAREEGGEEATEYSLEELMAMKPANMSEAQWNKLIHQSQGVEMLGEPELVSTPFGFKQVYTVTQKAKLKGGATQRLGTTNIDTGKLQVSRRMSVKQAKRLYGSGRYEYPTLNQPEIAALAQKAKV